jgi:hypothetical protein
MSYQQETYRRRCTYDMSDARIIHCSPGRRIATNRPRKKNDTFGWKFESLNSILHYSIYCILFLTRKWDALQSTHSANEYIWAQSTEKVGFFQQVFSFKHKLIWPANRTAPETRMVPAKHWKASFKWCTHATNFVETRVAFAADHLWIQRHED